MEIHSIRLPKILENTWIGARISKPGAEIPIDPQELFTPGTVPQAVEVAKPTPAPSPVESPPAPAPAGNVTLLPWEAGQDTWGSRIDQALQTSDPGLKNHEITQLHYELGQALRDFTGPDAGANFHSWAVWGSKKAGTTIRQEDIPGLRTGLTVVGTVLGGIVGGLGGAVAGGVVANLVTKRQLQRSSQDILQGNMTVLDDIGHATGHFLETFGADTKVDPAKLSAFLQTLRPGPTENGGQDLLRQAFTNYYNAKFEADPKKKQEMMYWNCQAVLHEHIRLQPYISDSMPHLLQHFFTGHQLKFVAGDEPLAVGRDLPALRDGAFPEALQKVDNPDLQAFLTRFDRSPDELQGSGAHNWANLDDRMNFIVDLFRSRHDNPHIFDAPYPA